MRRIGTALGLLLVLASLGRADDRGGSAGRGGGGMSRSIVMLVAAAAFDDPGDGGESSDIGMPTMLDKAANKPPIVSRTGWECPDGQNSPKWAPNYREITHIIVHHTAIPNTDTDWPARVKQMWDYHTNTDCIT